MARLTSEPFSSVRSTSTNFTPPGAGFARGVVTGLVRKRPRCTGTVGNVASAQVRVLLDRIEGTAVEQPHVRRVLSLVEEHS